MKKVYCLDCEWSGYEKELRYKKKKLWASPEDAICPICGGYIEYEIPDKDIPE